MKHRTLCTWFTSLVCFSVIFTTNAHPSSTPVASNRPSNILLNRANENSRTEDADFETQQEAPASTVSPRLRTTPEQARRSPYSPRLRTATDGAGRQRINDPQTGPPFDMMREENGMMDPSTFMNPWAMLGMRWANALQRSMRPEPWNTRYPMNPVVSFWKQFAMSLVKGIGYGFGAQSRANAYPGQYSGISDGRYGPSRYASYPETEFQDMYGPEPAASSYYRNQLPVSSSRPYNRGQRIPQPAQPYYRNQRVEENAQTVPGAGRVSQNYRQHSNTPSSESYVQPPRNNASAGRGYREPPTNAIQSDTWDPSTLLRYNDPPSNSNVPSPTSSEYRNQRTQSNRQRERVEKR